MNLSKQSIFHIDTFIKNLKKKEKEIDVLSDEVSAYFNQMVEIKDYLGTVYNDDKISVTDRTKIFMEKLKKLETLGEKHDKCVKSIKDLKEKIDLEIDILVKNINQLNKDSSEEQIRNYIFQYIESKR